MKDELDPRGLIRESYRIDRITASQCRSIFLDWVLGLPVDEEPRPHILRLLERHAGERAGHPMTAILRAALATGEKTGRRGGRAARLAPKQP